MIHSHKILTIALTWTAALASAPVRAGGGVDLAQVVSWPEQSVMDLVASAGGPKIAAAQGKTAMPEALVDVSGSLPVNDVLNAAPMSFGDLITKVTGTQRTEPVAPPTASVAVVTAPSAPTAKPMTLEIRETKQGLRFNPETLSFNKAGTTAALHINGKSLADLNLFVRDQSVVELKQATGELKAKQKGVTELYAVAKGKMYILPITVQAGGAQPSSDLKVPDALVSLDGVFQGSMQSALYPGLEPASGAPTKEAVAEARVSGGLEAPSLQDSVEETARSMLRQAHEAERFYTERSALNYKAVTLQVIDDRSVPSEGRLYPVANARVHLVGTEFSAPTDATGHLTIRDVPQKSRFLIRIDDPSGEVRPALAELSTREDGSVARFKVIRSFSFDAFSQIAGTVQNANLGSYCATIVDRSANAQPVAGIAVAAAEGGEGPFYFNSYGFLDRAQNATGPDGRACFFNVTPGPLTLTYYQDQAPVATVGTSIWAGRHVEEPVDLGREAVLHTRLAAVATAQEQLSNDPRAAAGLKSIDMIDLIPLGTRDPLAQLSSGEVTSGDPLANPTGRLRALAQAAEFEPVVYTYRDGDKDSVTPLLPRGFVEDMSLYAQVTRDPELGTVLAEYAAAEGAAQETIAMRLVDLYGHDVGDGWYYSDAPVTKAIFFNVPAGTYGLLVETKDGYWLGSDTVTVYNETVSYARMGSQIRFRP